MHVSLIRCKRYSADGKSQYLVWITTNQCIKESLTCHMYGKAELDWSTHIECQQLVQDERATVGAVVKMLASLNHFDLSCVALPLCLSILHSQSRDLCFVFVPLVLLENV